MPAQHWPGQLQGPDNCHSTALQHSSYGVMCIVQVRIVIGAEVRGKEAVSYLDFRCDMAHWVPVACMCTFRGQVSKALDELPAGVSSLD